MKDSNDIMILDTVERYIRGEMNPDERLYFENLRKTNSEIDQLVVEHTLFLQQMNRFGEWQKFKSSLNEVHTNLSEQGNISSDKLKGKARVVYLWKKYKRVTAIAASIAGITALTISGIIWSISPQPNNQKILELDRVIKDVQKEQRDQKGDLNNLKEKVNLDPAVRLAPIEFKSGGTGFLINGRGLMITNAHIVKNSKNIRVFNVDGEQFNAFVVRLDPSKDVAVIKIDDPNFKPFASLPYGISRNSSEIAEPIFTLGFPRDEIVYGEGYLSAKTGFNGDTLSCQISIAANPGNSGGPVFNHKGEVIGILSRKEAGAESTVFAIRSKYIYKAIDELKKNPLYENVKISSKSLVDNLDKVQQVKKIQDYVFMVKGD
jgi:S1-C subfamily serine protease